MSTIRSAGGLGQMNGVDLYPVLAGGAKLGRQNPNRYLAWQERMLGIASFALTGDRFKFLTNLSADGEKEALLDLLADRGESTTVIGKDREVADRARRDLEAVLPGEPPRPGIHRAV